MLYTEFRHHARPALFLPAVHGAAALFEPREAGFPAGRGGLSISTPRGARCCGASSFRLSKPGIIAGCLLVFIPALGAYVTPLILGGGKHLMIGNLIAQQFGSGRNWPLGSAQALILMAVVLVALYFYVAQHLGPGEAWLKPRSLSTSRPSRASGRRPSSASFLLYCADPRADGVFVQFAATRSCAGRVSAATGMARPFRTQDFTAPPTTP